MPEWTGLSGGNDIESAADLTNSRGISVAAIGTNAKGNWTQLIAALAYDTDWLHVMLHDDNLPNNLWDIGVGANPNEKVVVSNLLFNGRGGSENYGHLLLPIHLTKGQRLVARKQSATNNGVGYIIAQPMGPTFASGDRFQRCTTYGANTADSGGADLDPGGSANTKGTWQQIVASTTNPMRALAVGLGTRGNAVIGVLTRWLIDIGIGANPNEKVLIPNIGYIAGTSEVYGPPLCGPFFVSVPAGTRISARAQCTNTDATDRLLDIIVYGMD